MFINSITAQNVKGLTFTHELKPATIFVGDNATGKTARLDAIRLLLKGYLPRLGVQPSSTMMLAGTGDRTMKVSGMTHNGHMASRAWTRGKGTAISKEETPFKFDIPDVLIDPASEFFKLSPGKRIDFVFQTVKTSQALNPDSLVVEVKNLSFDPNTEVTQGAVADVVAQLTDSIMTYHQRKTQDPDFTFQVWLDEELAMVKEQLKTEKQNVDRMCKSIAAGVQLTPEQKLDLPTLEDLQRSLTVKITELNHKIATTTEQIAANDKKRDRLVHLQSRLAQIPESNIAASELVAKRELVTVLTAARSNEMSNLRLANSKLEALTKQSATFAESKRKLDAIDNQLVELANVVAEHGSLTEVVNAYSSKTTGLRVEVTALEQREIDIRTQRVGLETHWQDRHGRLLKMVKDKCCPTCGMQGDDFAEVISTLIGSEQYANAQTRERFAETEAELKLGISTLRDQLKSGEEQDKDNLARTRRLHELSMKKVMLQGLTTQRSLILESLVNSDLAPQIQELRDYAQSCTSKINDLNASLSFESKAATDLELAEANRQSRELLTAEMSGIKIEFVEPIDSAVLDHKTALTQDLERVQTDIKKAAAERQSEIIRRRAEDELAGAKARVMVLKSVCDTFSDKRSTLVDIVFGPVLMLANKIVQPVLGKSLIYLGGLIGFEGVHFVPTECFSGTEEAITYAGIALALATQCPLKLVILDEIGRLSLKNKQALIGTVLDLIRAGVIDQFIGVDVDASSYEPWLACHEVALINVG